MSTVTTVPGIYIEEDASPAISVSQGATAVPLFVARFKPLESENSRGIIRIGSWLDFIKQFSATVNLAAAVKITSTEETEPEPGAYAHTYNIDSVTVSENTAALALKLYFQNGGNACYVYTVPDTPVSLPARGKTKADDTNKILLDALPVLMDEAGDITLILAPDNDAAYRSAVYSAVNASLEQNKGYFLLIDSSNGSVDTAISSSSHAAVYYPALNHSTQVVGVSADAVSITGYKDKNNTAGTEITTLAALESVNSALAKSITDRLVSSAAHSVVTIQPSALLAGVYCKTDLTRGVWKAPANVVLNGITDVSVRVTDDVQGTLNLAGINVIRHFSDRGVVVWGARTLQDDDNWRYIPVRRLFDAAERDIKKAMRPMVFEPNNQMTWQRIKTAVENYLYRLWQQGGLAGNKVDEAYFVRIGKDITMTSDDISQGKMIVQVGMAAVRPAEFIILQFTQNMAQ